MPPGLYTNFQTTGTGDGRVDPTASVTRPGTLIKSADVPAPVDSPKEKDILDESRPKSYSSELLPFPLNLAQAINNRPYPAICFTYLTPKNNTPGDRIFLPMPAGLEIADSMNYSTLDLGIIGDIVADTIKGAQGGNGAFDTLKKGFIGMGTSIYDKAKSANLAAGASIAARQFGQEKIANVIDFQNKQIVTPNTNTTFQGSNIRSYNYKFKMVAQSEAESIRIKAIVSRFRRYMYPVGTALLQEYPGTWEISFVYGENYNVKNKFIPEPYRCYLTNFSSIYNSDTNMWHADGAPVEVDIAMNFQEVKALTYQHVNLLENQQQPSMLP